jgi:hypothetical protein
MYPDGSARALVCLAYQASHPPSTPTYWHKPYVLRAYFRYNPSPHRLLYESLYDWYAYIKQSMQFMLMNKNILILLRT